MFLCAPSQTTFAGFYHQKQASAPSTPQSIPVVKRNKHNTNMVTFNFENIVAWQKAHKFVLNVYEATKHFPDEERFGLTSQFRRAAISIEANIAEGYKKLGKADKLRFMNIAQGSLEECRDYIILSRDLGYIDSTQFQSLYERIEEASKLLLGYCNGIINNSGIMD